MRLFGSPPEFQDEIDSFSAEFERLRAADSSRIQRYLDYRTECEATRETQLDLHIGDTDYNRNVRRRDGERVRTRFSFPFGQALTVKHAYRIAGRLPDAIVDRRQETPEERHRSDVMEKIWWGIVHESDGEVQFADAAWDGSQVGASPFQIYFDVKRQAPMFQAFDPAACVVVRGFDDPHNFERAYRWWEVPVGALIEKYRGREFRGREIDVRDITANETTKLVTVVQMASKEKTIRIALDSSQPHKGKHVALEEKAHGYGFVPYVVIPNLGPYRNIWGWSDYEFVREIVRYIPVLFGREADVIAMVANGAVKARGTKLTPAQIRRILAEGGVAPVGREGDIEPIQAPEMPAFSQAHSEMAFDILERLGFAPPAAWGAAGSSSGSDRGLQLQPMFELTSMKQKNWSAGLPRLASMAFQMIERFTTEPKIYSGTSQRGSRTSSFNVLVGPDVPPDVVPNGDNPEDQLELPRSPKELFAGDYRMRFNWQNRIDKDDPAFVTAELNKFAQGVQSARTTLENLGIQSPEDELKLIEQESEKFPWLRAGMLKLLEIEMGMQQQGANDGSQNAPSAGTALTDASATMQTKDGQALDLDAMTSSLPGGVGTPFGGA